jgi:glycosyltransferase involved in cell wall biosynthesis
MNICIALITYNRLEYTKKTIVRLLEDKNEEFELYIWDNASGDGTVEYLQEQVKDPRIVEIVLSKENVGQVNATNAIWSKTKAEFLGKMDNDCLVTPGWTRTLSQAHKDIPELGAVACWHFSSEDFDYERAKHKIQTFGQHQILRHPWTGGTGVLTKKVIFENFGPIQGTGTTEYWLKIALAGFINGFYFPLVYMEHMDDMLSKHCRLHRMSYDDAYRYMPAYQSGWLKDFETYKRVRKQNINNLLTDPFGPKYYVGCRAKFRRALEKAKRLLFK